MENKHLMAFLNTVSLTIAFFVLLEIDSEVWNLIKITEPNLNRN